MRKFTISKFEKIKMQKEKKKEERNSLQNLPPFVILLSHLFFISAAFLFLRTSNVAFQLSTSFSLANFAALSYILP